MLQRHAILYEPADYGFNLFKAAFPRRLLSRAKEALFEKYQSCVLEHTDLPICVIGHSFGTLAIGCLLEENRDVSFERIILAGSILRRKYPWHDRIGSRQVKAILNEVSSDDLVVRGCPLLKLAWPPLKVGRSGCLGFVEKHNSLRQRTHRVGHSGALSKVTCKKTWVPFLLGEDPDTFG